MAIWFLTDERYLRQRMPGAVVSWLRSQRSCEVRLIVVDRVRVHADGPTIEWPFDDIAADDIIVSRSRHPLALTLLHAASRRGYEVVTPWRAVDSVRDKARCVEILSEKGIPTPETFLVAEIADLASLPEHCFPLILKPYLGDNAEGVMVVSGPRALNDLRWDDGLVLAQRWAETGGWDVKLYICGDQFWAVKRRSPLADEVLDDSARLLPVDDELRFIARSCRDVFGLPLCGVDVLRSDDGPLVVDVNDFPNYTGVAEAVAAIGTFLADWSRRPEPAMVGELA